MKLIQVLQLNTGAGKILFTKEIAGPAMNKIVQQVERRYGGIKSMELINMPSSYYDRLTPNQIATIEIGK